MARTRIKICSICSPEDARLAADAGADAVGLIFHAASKRNVTPEQAREIVGALPPFVTPVAVTVDMPVDELRGLAREVGVGHLQLHGDESEEAVAALAGFTLIKAVKVVAGTFAAELARWDGVAARHPQLRAVVLETATKEAGGSGVENDWSTIESAITAGPPRHLSIIVAGGLTPASVAGVVRRLRPHSVDVSSGVEAGPRSKSPEKVRDFVRAVRGADDAS